VPTEVGAALFGSASSSATRCEPVGQAAAEPCSASKWSPVPLSEVEAAFGSALARAVGGVGSFSSAGGVGGAGSAAVPSSMQTYRIGAGYLSGDSVTTSPMATVRAPGQVLAIAEGLASEVFTP
jgi:hypothetical protein